jgi:MoxR-like ATPase
MVNMYVTETKKIKRLVEANIPTLIIGQAGMGKSFTLKKAVESMGLEYTAMNLSKQNDLVDLLGQFVLIDDKDGNSITKWIEGPVTERAMNGGVLILEELTMGEPTILAALHGLFEENPTLMTLGNGKVEVHPDFRVCASANPSWTNYNGVSDLNYALEDRFAHVEFAFPSETAFYNYMKPFDAIFKKKSVKMESFYKMCKKLFEMYPDGVDGYLSLRGMKVFGKMLEFYKPKDALDIALLNRFSPSDRKRIGDIIDNQISLG